MTAILQDPIFQDETKAREWLEARVWPTGPVCPHCGVTSEHVTKLEGTKHRPGLYQCNECREQFTVTVNTVFERSKIPLTKWLAALFLMTASKKGISAHQVHRMLKVSYKSTWFMMHRLREAMRPAFPPVMGGTGKTVEMDEAYIGGLEKNKHASKRRGLGRGGVGKEPVIALIERGGIVHSRHIADVNAKNVGEILEAQLLRNTAFYTDDLKGFTAPLSHVTVRLKRSTTALANTFVATRTPTRWKVISQSLSAASLVPITMSASNI
jgi:transposase-like protein